MKLKNKFGATCQAKLRISFGLLEDDSFTAGANVEDFISRSIKDSFGLVIWFDSIIMIEPMIIRICT